jgi:hypothetical protein
MQSLKDDMELLRRKALNCEVAADAATDPSFRLLNLRRAMLYRELVAEAEATLHEQAASRFRASS